MPSGRGVGGRIVRAVLPHVIMVAFSAVILLPLVWLVRVTLTDKLTAYKIPPEWVALRPRQLRHDLHRLPFRRLLPEQHRGGCRLDRDLAAAGDGDGLCLRPLQHRRLPLRLFVLASQMLPPIILVLPLFAVFLFAGLIKSRAGLDHRAPHHQPAVPGLDAGVVLRGRDRAARGGGAGRRRHALAGLLQDRRAGRGARPAGRRPARLHPLAGTSSCSR